MVLVAVVVLVLLFACVRWLVAGWPVVGSGEVLPFPRLLGVCITTSGLYACRCGSVGAGGRADGRCAGTGEVWPFPRWLVLMACVLPWCLHHYQRPVCRSVLVLLVVVRCCRADGRCAGSGEVLPCRCGGVAGGRGVGFTVCLWLVVVRCGRAGVAGCLHHYQPPVCRSVVSAGSGEVWPFPRWLGVCIRADVPAACMPVGVVVLSVCRSASVPMVAVLGVLCACGWYWWPVCCRGVCITTSGLCVGAGVGAGCRYQCQRPVSVWFCRC